MATAGGAAALGLGEFGCLEPGRSAAMAFASAPESLREPLEWLVSGAARARRVEAA
jgi:cytosine/adenosine deaminase-related metal-dependent hydrolase